MLLTPHFGRIFWYNSFIHICIRFGEGKQEERGAFVTENRRNDRWVLLCRLEEAPLWA